MRESSPATVPGVESSRHLLEGGLHEETMVHKANQIALFFASYPQEEAIAGVASHIQQFWEPRMRRQIKQYIADGGGGLHELVAPAVERLKDSQSSRQHA